MAMAMANKDAAARIDALLEKVGAEYRALPRSDYLAMAFREALSRVGLPGGYVARGTVARPLSQSLKGGQQC
jgi:hypothetical protein